MDPNIHLSSVPPLFVFSAYLIISVILVISYLYTVSGIGHSPVDCCNAVNFPTVGHDGVFSLQQHMRVSAGRLTFTFLQNLNRLSDLQSQTLSH